MSDSLRFVNAIGQEISFSASSIYRLLSIDDLGSGEIVQQTVKSPYQDGSSAVGEGRFQSRVLKVIVAVIAEDKLNKIRDLNNRLNPHLGMGKLIYRVGEFIRTLDQVKVRQLPSLPDGDQAGKRYQISQIIFEAFDPLYTDTDETYVTVSSGAGTFTFPLNIENDFEFNYLNADGVIVQNTGDVEAPVRVEVLGPITAPLLIENLTTGKQIEISLDLLSAEKLTVTTGVSDLNVERTDTDTGETVNAFSYLDVDGTDFFQLALGPNAIRVTAAGTSVAEATLYYKNRYVGV